MKLREKLRFNFAINFFYKIATGSRRFRTIITPIGLVLFIGLTENN